MTEIVEGLHRAPGGPYRSLVRLSNVVIAFLTVKIVVDLASAVVDYQGMELVERIRAGSTVSFEEVDANDRRMTTSGILQLVALAAAAIPFVMWMRRAYRNLGSLGVRWLRFKPGWAVGGWFVPFLWWARPKSILNDVWRASNPELPRDVHRPPEGAYVPGLVNWWWALYIAGSVIYPSGFSEERDPTLEEIASTISQALAGDVCFVVAGILAIVVVRKVTLRQERRHAVIEGTVATPTAATVRPEGPPF